MLEMALTLPVFFILVLGMMDMSVHFMTQGLLNQAALSALNMASKLQGVENWTKGVPAAGVSVNRYNQVVQQIEDEALRVVSASFITPASAGSGGGWIQFLDTTRTVGNEEIEVRSTLMLLRPTETGTFLLSNGGADVVLHPTLPVGTGSQIQLLRRHPLYIELRAVQRPLLPFMPDMEIRAVATGFREINSANERAAQALLEFDNPPDNTEEDDPLDDAEDDDDEEEPVCVVDQARCIDMTNSQLNGSLLEGQTFCPAPNTMGPDGVHCKCKPCYSVISL